MTLPLEFRPLTELVAAMPKAELHVHLDGCVRPATAAELARQAGIPLPVPSGRLAEVMMVPPSCRDLVQYIGHFAFPLSLLQSAEALERVTYELVEDAYRENVRYLEPRFAPSLHLGRGLSRAEVIAAVVRGWEAARRHFGVGGGVILCGMRSLPPADTVATARAGLPFLGAGVVGFDLAGDEANFPVTLHRPGLQLAREAGYGLTIHAGEAAGPESVRAAIEEMGAVRVGHGVRTGEDEVTLLLVRARGVTLEMCPSSNLQTRAVPSLAEHPLPRYLRAGLSVTVNTDSRTVSGTDMTRELNIGRQIGLSLTDLASVTLDAVRAGFGEPGERRQLLEAYRTELSGLGIALPPA